MKYFIASFLFLLAIVAGSFWISKVWNTNELKGDDLIYNGIAKDILEKGSYTYEGKETNVEPLYPAFVAAIYRIGGQNQNNVRAIQLIIYGLTVVMVFFMTRYIYTAKAGLIAGLLSALFYGFATPTGFLNRETLLVFFSVLIAFSLIRAIKSPGPLPLVIAGCILGLYTLTNSSAQLLFIPLSLVLWYAIGRRGILYHPWKNRARLIACFVIAFLITIAPWTIRNIRKADTVVSARSGHVLLRRFETAHKAYENFGLNLIGYTLGYYFAEKHDPDIVKKAFATEIEVEKREVAMLEEGKSYGEIDRIFLKDFVKGVLKEPHVYLSGVILNFLHFNNPVVPDKDNFGNTTTILMFAEHRHLNRSDLLKSFILIGLRLAWLLFYALIIYGIFCYRRTWTGLIGLLVPITMILYFTAVFSLSHGLPRFALPIYPFYFMLFSIGLHGLYLKMKK